MVNSKAIFSNEVKRLMLLCENEIEEILDGLFVWIVYDFWITLISWILYLLIALIVPQN